MGRTHVVAIVARGAIQTPEHPEQRTWTVAWVFRNGDAIFADSLTDIVSVLIPGYEDLDDDHEDDLHLNARIDALVPLARQAQELTLADLAHREHRLSNDELNAALLDKEKPTSLERWNPAEPLILLTTTYTPYTDDEAPEGSIMWLDPTNEAVFLESLRKVGHGELWIIGEP